jgi:hypothetical protein
MSKHSKQAAAVVIETAQQENPAKLELVQPTQEELDAKAAAEAAARSKAEADATAATEKAEYDACLARIVHVLPGFATVATDRKAFAGCATYQYKDAVLVPFLGADTDIARENLSAYKGRTDSNAYFTKPMFGTRLMRAMDGHVTTKARKSKVDAWRDVDGSSMATDLRRIADAVEDIGMVRIATDTLLTLAIDDQLQPAAWRKAYVTANWDGAIASALLEAQETANEARKREPMADVEKDAVDIASSSLKTALAVVRGPHVANDDDALQSTLAELRKCAKAFNAVTAVRPSAFDF